MIRPPYGAFHQLSATVAAGQAPDPAFRDPRIPRDQMHDMRMPPYMRDEMITALGLTRRQYEELMAYVAAGAAQTPLGRRVQRRLRMAAAAQQPMGTASGSSGSPQ